uniref:hypothetical protein n=1 Tax=Ponticaulis koreensis TaxID=1123045 RepID=UPI0004279DAC|nr:hypothetical protein [Ponticaulis koreensis]
MPPKLSHAIIWTGTGVFDRFWIWALSCIVFAVSFGRFGKSYRSLNTSEYFSGEFDRDGVSGRDLKRAFRVAIQHLSPVPLDEARILAMQTNRGTINYVVTRNKTELVSFQHLGINVDGRRYITGPFSSLRIVVLIVIALSLIGSLTTSVLRSNTERDALEIQLQDLQFSNEQLRSRLVRTQSNSQILAEANRYIDQIESWSSPSSHHAILENMSNLTPDGAWWNTVQFDGQSVVFEMRAANANAVLSGIAQPETHPHLRPGPRISTERQGVESFSIVATSPYGDSN